MIEENSSSDDYPEDTPIPAPSGVSGPSQSVLHPMEGRQCEILLVLIIISYPYLVLWAGWIIIPISPFFVLIMGILFFIFYRMQGRLNLARWWLKSGATFSVLWLGFAYIVWLAPYWDDSAGLPWWLAVISVLGAIVGLFLKYWAVDLDEALNADTK
jgi:hypothetical protein